MVILSALVLAFCGGGGKRMDEYFKALGEDGRSLLERMEEDTEGHRLTAGCDFSAGGDESVLVVRQGNVVKGLVRWRDKDTMASVGRFISEFRKWKLKPE